MKGILRTLALTGIVAAAAAAAQAQVAIGVGIQPAYPVAYDSYVPACPGVGFVWTPGYYTGRIGVPGRWIHHDDYAFARRDFRYDHRDYHVDNRGWDHGRR